MNTQESSDSAAGGSAENDEGKDNEEEVEGVFVIKDGKALFRPTVVGIAGSNYFQVISGPGEGDKVVSGPFKAINELKDGDPVKVTEKSRGKSSPRSSS
jgi:HlyD family secretion protein